MVLESAKFQYVSSHAKETCEPLRVALLTLADVEVVWTSQIQLAGKSLLGLLAETLKVMEPRKLHELHISTFCCQFRKHNKLVAVIQNLTMAAWP